MCYCVTVLLSYCVTHLLSVRAERQVEVRRAGVGPGDGEETGEEEAGD